MTFWSADRADHLLPVVSNDRTAPSGADRAPNQSGAGRPLGGRASTAQAPEGIPLIWVQQAYSCWK